MGLVADGVAVRVLGSVKKAVKACFWSGGRKKNGG